MSLSHNINIISRCSRRFREAKLRRYGLKGSQPVCIMTICKSPGISQDGIAKINHMDKSNVTRQLNTLEQEGYITRITSKDDRRFYEIYPTDKAQLALPDIKASFREWNSLITQMLTKEEISQLESLIEKVRIGAIALDEEGYEE
ncbi:MAG: MarR family transcriptional regulator [Clostridiaceae bacterium]|nr:MarR family transcriptional regulator [Clostridiaceae bacterium]